MVSTPTTYWKTVKKGGNPLTDPLNDQQTGSGGAGGEADLVSTQSPNFNEPLLYTLFDRGTTASSTDGTLYFRARLGIAGNKGGFDRALFVYVFANADDKIDLVVGVNNASNPTKVGLWNPGAQANTSPNTTSITPLTIAPQSTSTAYTYAPSGTTNFNATLVSSAIEPGVTSTDIDGDGNDIFVGFGVDFADVTAQLAKNGVSGVTENTQLRFVLATATQENSLNQDIGGVGSGYDVSATYSALGAVTDPFAPRAVSLPEPGSLPLVGMAVAGATSVIVARRRRAIPSSK